MADRTKFLELARLRFKQADEASQKQREREREALRFYAGEQWDRDTLNSRAGQTIGSGTTQQVVPARPSLTINKTREPVRQVLNQERASDYGIELIPADDFGELAGPIDHTEIELREGLVRRIQRDSEAADARTWAFARSAICGTGYWLVMTRFVPGKTWDQEVYIERIYNQNSVLLDPAHEQPDGSDCDWGFYGRDVPWAEYKADYPSSAAKHNIVTTASDDEWRAFADAAPDWFVTDGDTKSVRVMNYYYTDRTERTLALLADGTEAWEDELPEGVTPKETRTVVEKAIKWAKIDGAQVLDETDWPGHYIPIIKEVGEELQPYDQERRCEGIVQPMMDACRGNNYIISKFVERVGLTPISPWMMAAGQDENFEAEYDAANTRALSRLHYNMVDSFGKPAAPPFRVDARSEIADIGMGVQLFGQAIASTSVVPETALGNVDPTVKSGKLAKMLLQQAERGTSNFLDNHVRSMRHEARVVNDLLYPIYGARPGRLARLMNPQGEMSAVLIDQPFVMQGQGDKAKPQPIPMPPPIPGQPAMPLPQGAQHYKLTPNAEFNVAVKVSKSYDTRREQESETLGELISADPQLMTVVGDLFFKYQDGPGHEEMSERLKAILVPPVQALLKGQQAPDPQMQAQMAAMQQQMQQLAEMADKNKTDLAKTQLQQQAETQRTQMEIQAKERLALIQQAGVLAATDAKLDAENARTFVEAAEARISKALDLHLQRVSQVADHLHDARTQATDHQHELQMAQMGHEQALEQGQQAAALAPTPTDGAA